MISCLSFLPCVLGSNEVVIVIFCSFEIEEVAVNASTFFFIRTSHNALDFWDCCLDGSMIPVF